MITPRRTRLLRARDLRGLHRAVVSALPSGPAARSVAVILPTSAAAEAFRQTLEELLLGEGRTAIVLPDLVTRRELYRRLHDGTSGLPPLLTEFERDVLLRLAAEDAALLGAAAPFRLRPGLLAAILTFYDELRRRLRTIDSFDRLVRERLEAGSETDRGAARLLAQTAFLAATFAGFEGRVADSGRLDEHALRTLALNGDVRCPWRHVIVAVADRTADPGGLWPSDFDLLSRIPGLERLDVVSTESVLASGWHDRLHGALPEIEESRTESGGDPVLRIPAVEEGRERTAYFVSRDREEELMDAARWIKARARPQEGMQPVVPDATAVVFGRPLPYLYLAHQVFTSAAVPYQAHDALPLAAEPPAAALDLLFAVLAEEPTRTSIVDLLASPLWNFHDPAAPDHPVGRQEAAALERVLQDVKFLGGWDALERWAGELPGRAAGSGREARRWARAARPLAAAVAIGRALGSVREAGTASGQLSALLTFLAAHERLPASADEHRERHMRARSAIVAAIAALRDAHARYDDRPLRLEELVATLRRWIEGQTFSPRTGSRGVLLIDASSAAFASVDAVRLVGLVEPEWPERAPTPIFYPASLLRDIGWPPEAERLTAARARFHDLLRLPAREISVSAFTLEDDALVSPSAFLEDLVSSGLPVESVGDGRAPRIFVHEALMYLPVDETPLHGSARAWLAVRKARTAHTDPRFRGSVGPRPPGVYGVSRVERYLECPFKYFAGEVLRLEEEREDESGLTPQERGQLLHGVFEAFFLRWRDARESAITPGNLDAAIALFTEVAEAHLSLLPEADRALERTYLLGSAAAPGLAERAFAVEIEQETPVVERLLEFGLEGTFRFEGEDGPRDVQLRGKADRIDLLADGTLRIIDYKLGRAPKAGRALQLPVYGVCASQYLERERGGRWPVARAGYVAFRERGAFVDLAGRAGDLERALREGQSRFLAALDGIERGDFRVDPDEPWMCTRCGFPHVCRKDYVGDE